MKYILILLVVIYPTYANIRLEGDYCNDQEDVCMKCSHDRINGFIRREAINEDALGDFPIISLLSLARFNGVEGTACKSGFGYDKTNKGFFFEVELGQCNMDATTFKGRDGEKFTTSINFGAQNKNFAGNNFFFGKYGSYEFNCNYRQWLRTAPESFQPLIEEIPTSERKLDQFVSWDSTIELKFFDSSFEKPLDPSTLYLGSTMYFQAIWTETFTDKFPVEFHLSECTIRDKTSDKSFDMIKDGCGARVIWTTLLSDSAYQREHLRWSYRSFQFDRDQAGADMSLDCKIVFCLRADRLNGSCLTTADNCAIGYAKPPNFSDLREVGNTDEFTTTMATTNSATTIEASSASRYYSELTTTNYRELETPDWRTQYSD